MRDERWGGYLTDALLTAVWMDTDVQTPESLQYGRKKASKPDSQFSTDLPMEKEQNGWMDRIGWRFGRRRFFIFFLFFWRDAKRAFQPGDVLERY